MSLPLLSFTLAPRHQLHAASGLKFIPCGYFQFGQHSLRVGPAGPARMRDDWQCPIATFQRLTLMLSLPIVSHGVRYQCLCTSTFYEFDGLLNLMAGASFGGKVLDQVGDALSC